MRRGTIVWLNLEDVAPPEMGKTRPGIIISNTDQNSLIETVVAVPFSTQPPHVWPLRIGYGKIGAKPNFAIVPGVRQVKKMRLLETIGIAPQDFLHLLEGAVHAYLND